MSQPPKWPWIKGEQPEYTAFQLVVNICQDTDGNVWSNHDYATGVDGALAQGLSQGGAPQVAHALLTEAIRREAFMCALIERTKDSEFLDRWRSGDEDVRAEIEAQIGNYTRHVISKTLEKMVPGATAGILSMMAKTAQH